MEPDSSPGHPGPRTNQFVSIEPQCQLCRGEGRAAIAQQVAVVPAVAVKSILNQRRAHDVANLTAVEARTQLLHHLFSDHITAPRYAINPRKANVAAASDQCGQ